MVNANELRVGNWVKWNEDDTFMRIGASSFLLPDKRFDPTPLTPEILEKCAHRINVIKWHNEAGEEFVTTDYFFEEKTGVLKARFVEGDILFWFKYNPDDRPRLMSDELVFYNNQHIFRKREYYLHQLQNLYLALTGEELKIFM